MMNERFYENADICNECYYECDAYNHCIYDERSRHTKMEISNDQIKWTNRMPIKSGDYIVRRPGWSYPEVVTIKILPNGWENNYNKDGLMGILTSFAGSWWLGPLPDYDKKEMEMR